MNTVSFVQRFFGLCFFYSVIEFFVNSVYFCCIACHQISSIEEVKVVCGYIVHEHYDRKKSKFNAIHILNRKTELLLSTFERPNWDEYFMLQAELAKLRSNCVTRQVGAVTDRNHRQLATGYNGTPPGIKNCFDGGCKRCQLRMEGKIESGASLDRCLCNHAEANAIMHCAILGIEAGIEGAVLYTTFVPCLECTKMAITIGIRKFVCLDSYPETDFDLLKEAGVEVIQLDKSKIAKWAQELVNKYNSG